MKPADKISLDELVQELQRRERSDPLAEVYEPTARQIEVHKCRTQVCVISGANRSGKTYSMVADALYFCLHRPVYAELPSSPVTVWYIMPSLGMFERAIYPILTRLLPIGVVQSFPVRPQPIMTFTNGSKLYFLSSDMKKRRLAAAAVDQIYMDETPDEAAYDELQARTMSTRGRIILGFLPEQTSEWVETRLEIPWRAGDRRDISCITIPIADEDTGESLVPWFTKKDIDDFKRKWPDPAVQAARIYGRRVKQAGMVFKTYEPIVHHVPPFDIPRNWLRWLVCDPQYARFACLWFAADENSNYYISDEFFSQEATLRHRAERMAALTDARGKVDPQRPLPVYVDSANPTDIAELNWHFSELSIPLAALKLPFTKVKNIRHDESMILRLHSLLESDADRPYPKIAREGVVWDGEVLYGAPRIFFFETLYSVWYLDGVVQYGSRLFWELEHYKWGKDGRPDAKTADGGDTCDTLMYGSNIMGKGRQAPLTDPRTARLSLKDRVTWNLIHRHDRLDRFAGRR